MAAFQLALPVVIVSLSLGALTAGCAATRHIANPSAPPTDLALHSATGDVELRLHHVITPDGPGSWVQGAKWNEWAVSFKNLGKHDVTIDKISLIDPRGVYVEANYSSLERLESESEQLARTYQNLGILSGVSPLLGQGIGQITMATGSLIPYYLSTPLILGLSNMAPYMEARDREAIQAEYIRRRLSVPMRLSNGAALTGSAFFPLIPQPRTLVVSYTTSKGTNQIEIALPKDVVQSSAQGTGQKP